MKTHLGAGLSAARWRSGILAQPTKIKRAVIELIYLIYIKENIFRNLDSIINPPVFLFL
jgi:hypothetical protein